MQDILTLTLNPAVDVSTQVETVTPVHKLRCSAGVNHPGGGGINVARVAHRLGSSSLALFPSGGVMGQALQSLLTQEGLGQQPIAIAQETRQNFSIHETSSGQDYRFVLPGPRMSSVEWGACQDAFLAQLPASTHAVVSGSLPLGLADDSYAELSRRVQAQGRQLILDASGEALKQALRTGVALVKPSLRELSDLMGQVLTREDDYRAAAASLVAQHQAEIVAVSLGEAGALVVTARQHWRARALPVPVRSTIGAGDSFLGGWLHGWRLQGTADLSSVESILQAFRWAMATAASAVSSYGTALCDPAQVQSLLAQVDIETL
jgi:6-phosphofructokinase 2